MTKKGNNKVNIAVIQTDVKWIRRSICDIKETVKEVPQIQTDVGWLKFWHNKIVLGVIISLIGILFFALRAVVNG